MGNALGLPMCCYALLDGSETDATAPLDITFCALEYDRERAIKRAEEKLGVIPRIDTFINEVRTGVYSRN